MLLRDDSNVTLENYTIIINTYGNIMGTAWCFHYLRKNMHSKWHRQLEKCHAGERKGCACWNRVQ
jgi:hypothetical protein